MDSLDAKDGDAPRAELLKSLCAMGLKSWIWFILWESGEAQRFTDILHNRRLLKNRAEQNSQKTPDDGARQEGGGTIRSCSTCSRLREDER